MKVCDIDRNLMYSVLQHGYRALQVQPYVVELGVCKGGNAQQLLQRLDPAQLVLVDSWSTASNREYCPFAPPPSWIDPPEAYDFYFGGPTWEQATWDRLQDGCQQRFAAEPRVSIVRSPTADALPAVRQLNQGAPYNLIYVDASHQYEDVLRDLMLYQELVGANGAFMLNDCCLSDAGLRQNLGVLEAGETSSSAEISRPWPSPTPIGQISSSRAKAACWSRCCTGAWSRLSIFPLSCCPPPVWCAATSAPT